MKTLGAEQIVRTAGAFLAVLAGVASLVVDGNGDLKIILLMAGAVAAGLISFDTAMSRRHQSFAPWVLLSLAPVAKTVPTVWANLRSDSGLLVERYDHAGSLLFGACVFGAVALLARPAKRLGTATGWFGAGVVVGSAATGALAGASIAFLADPRFGSPTAARAFETPTWFVLSGLLAAAAIAASHARAPSPALTGALALGCATSAVLAVSVVGRDVDPGWWGLLFAGFAVTAAVTDGNFGARSTRDRQTNVAVIVALIVGLVAAASAIAARSDRTAWGPGWALLGIVSLAMFALAMATKPADRIGRVTASRADDLDDAAARERAMQSLQRDSHRHPDIDAALTPESSVEAFAEQLDGRRVRRPADPVVSAPTGSPELLSPAQPQGITAATPTTAVASPLDGSGPALVAEEPMTPLPAVPSQPDPQVQPGSPQQPQRVVDKPRIESPAALSDVSFVRSAKEAAVVRDAPQPQRHSLAPLEQAHYFDPSTGLLSSAGLQHALARAFAVRREAGHVTMLMFMIRDLDGIEEDHGRLASAAVTREVADRIATLLPQGTGARFARSAYAVVFVADMSNVAETAQWLARVLLQLRAPVEGGSLGDKIDVVAGMAQCYEGEDAAKFVERANQGLVRAAHMAEPTLVAMP